MLTFLFTALFLCSKAQESPFTKFGKVTITNLQKKIYSIDSSADAVVLSDIGETSIKGNSKGWFSLSITRDKVVHILNKNGYDEADVEIPLYTNGESEENLEDIKGVTYNLDGTKVVETKLEKNAVFTEKRNKNFIIKKFTLPNIKEGCIIEFQYKVTSDFIEQIDPWAFQGTTPRLWSEFKFSVPQFFSYAFLSHGYLRSYISDKKDRIDNFTVRENNSTATSKDFSFTAGVTDYRWVMKDIPELKEEKFTSALENHLSRIEFQLASQTEPLTPHDFRGSWPALTKELMESEYFGKPLTEEYYWLTDEVKKITTGTSSSIQKAKKIYEYVRDGFTCTDKVAVYAEQSLKNTFKAKKGSISEISLLLIVMLRHAEISADPVILSRRSLGFAYELYPILRRFNYVIAKAVIDGKTYYLDATHSYLGFGKLMPECYNGHARVVNEEATALYLVADSIKERKVTALFLNNDVKEGWVGHVSQTAGYYESYDLRSSIKEKGEAAFFKDIQNGFGNDVQIDNSRIDSLNNYDEPLALRYDLKYASAAEYLLYINPMFTEAWKKNPFTSAQRLYPVEMPYTIDETYLLTMEIPVGYTVDELPKQLTAKYDAQGESFFEYRLQQSGNTISLRSRIKLVRAYYEPEEYESLRAFFSMIVKKHSEQIVLKKKK